MSTPAATLLALCRRLVDSRAQPLAVHPGHNNTVALRMSTTSGEVIAKLHRGPDRHRQEIHAYTHWTAAIQERAPRLLAISDDPPAIVITALPGCPLAETPLTPALEAEAHRQAGAILRSLHDAAPAVDEPNMTGWLAHRGEHWLARAQHLLSLARRAEIRAHLRALAALDPIAAVPCHLDYTPRNLLCAIQCGLTSPPQGHQSQPGGGTPRISIGTFDFEHARYDLAARDLVRLATRVWNHRPDLEDAFLRGYGQLSDLDRQVIEHCSHLDSLTRTVRASELHGMLGCRSGDVRPG